VAGPSNVRAQRIDFKMLSGFVYPQRLAVACALSHFSPLSSGLGGDGWRLLAAQPGSQNFSAQTVGAAAALATSSIPFIKAGRCLRFDPNEVLNSLKHYKMDLTGKR